MSSETDSDFASSCMYPSDYDTDSITSSVFGFTCKISYDRAVNQTDLEYQFLSEKMYLIDTDEEIWLKCDDCGACYHQTCWETFDENIPAPFNCCKYTLFEFVIVF